MSSPRLWSPMYEQMAKEQWIFDPQLRWNTALRYSCISICIRSIQSSWTNCSEQAFVWPCSPCCTGESLGTRLVNSCALLCEWTFQDWFHFGGGGGGGGGGGDSAPLDRYQRSIMCARQLKSGIESMIGRLWYNGSKRLGLRVMICTYVHTVVSRKYAHPRKYTHPPLLRQVVAKGHLLLESTPTLLARRGEEEIALEEVLSKRWD